MVTPLGKEVTIIFMLKSMVDIETFVKKRRTPLKEESVSDKIKKLPWYKKPLNREDFTCGRGKNNKLYVRHKEWHNTIWIGPYDTQKDIDDIIDSYLVESRKQPLDRKINSNIHSVKIEDYKSFFKKD